jgi:hypothetical protein
VKRRGERSLAFVALTAMALAAPTVASAQDVLPPYEILTILRSTGLDPVGSPARRGGEYVLRAIDADGTHVRVVMDARMGEILSVTPVIAGAPGAPPGPVVRRYEPAEAPDYIAPSPPRAHRGEPRIYDDEPPPRIYRRGPAGYDDEPPAIESRPPAPVPNSPPRVITATRDADPAPTHSVPRASASPVQSEAGLLPPPPERFPPRVAPAAAKPAPVKRAAVLPKQPPLPRPRPATTDEAMPQAAPADTSSAAGNSKLNAARCGPKERRPGS